MSVGQARAAGLLESTLSPTRRQASSQPAANGVSSRPGIPSISIASSVTQPFTTLRCHYKNARRPCGRAYGADGDLAFLAGKEDYAVPPLRLGAMPGSVHGTAQPVVMDARAAARMAAASSPPPPPPPVHSSTPVAPSPTRGVGSALRRTPSPAANEAELRKIFQLADINHSGYIDEAELLGFGKAVNPTFTAEHCRMLLKKMDTSRDGQVSPSEFIVWASNILDGQPTSYLEGAINSMRVAAERLATEAEQAVAKEAPAQQPLRVRNAESDSTRRHTAGIDSTRRSPPGVSSPHRSSRLLYHGLHAEHVLPPGAELPPDAYEPLRPATMARTPSSQVTPPQPGASKHHRIQSVV